MSEIGGGDMRGAMIMACWGFLSALAACSDGGDDGDGSKGGQATAGTTATAGAAGKTATAGSGGNGGSSAGGAGASTAGSSGAAGSTSGGSGGSGGSAGGDCAVLCSKQVIQACLGEFCVETCELAKTQFTQFFPDCLDEWNAQFACAAKQPNDNLMCSQGKITSPACTAEQNALMACGM